MGIVKATTEALYRVYNFVQREFAYTSQVDLQGKFMPYGPGDNFPNKLAELIDGSPTATSCLSTTTDFVSGEGFSDGAGLENMIINDQGLTLFQFHQMMSDSFVHYWGFAAMFKFSRAGRVTEVYPVPFNYCRLGKPDDNGLISKIHYNPYFGTQLYKAKDTEIYDTFNPDQAPGQIITDPDFKGQIFWFGIRDRKHPFYPIPDFYSAHRWMNVEKNAAVYYDENLERGFLQSSIIKLIGDPNDPSGIKDDAGNDIPKGKAFSQMMDKDFSGAKRNAKIMAFWGNNKEEWPEIVPFPSNASADLYRAQDEHATKKITIATKVPGILANISEGVSLGGDGNMLRAATKVMQQRVKGFQNILTDFYSKFLPLMAKNPHNEAVKVVPYNAFPELENVDPQIWEVMTAEERRKWVQDHTEIELLGDEVVEEQPAPAQNKVLNLHFNSYPKEARDNVKRALEYAEKMGARCLKPSGKKMSEAILNGAPLGPVEIKRLSRYLSKNTMHKDKSWDSCEALEYYAWGGSEMMVWANDKIKELNGKAD